MVEGPELFHDHLCKVHLLNLDGAIGGRKQCMSI